MAKDKISDYSSTANSNTDIAGINIDEGCAPSGINDAIRTLMAQLKTWQSGGQDVYIHPAGSASAPSITANGDTNTGIFFPAADTVGITTGGTERARVDSSGNLGLGTTSPTAKLTVSGNQSFPEKTAAYIGVDVATSSGNGGNFTVKAGNGSGVGNVSGSLYLGAGRGGSGASNGSIYFGVAQSTNAVGLDNTLMTLDASGNLGVGTTTPLRKLTSGGTSGELVLLGTGADGVEDALIGRISSQTRTSGSASTSSFASIEFRTGGFPWYSTGNIRFLTNSGDGTSGAGTERARIDSSGNLLVGKTSTSFSTAGIKLGSDFTIEITRSSDKLIAINRLSNDGELIQFYQDGTQEGNISVSGTTVSYNGGHLARYAQTIGAKDESLKKGTVLSNLDEMNTYTDAEGNAVDNEQLNKVKVSDVEGDANVAGVFVNWSHDEGHNVDEINMAMTGDMIIRIAQGTTVARGDLLMSAGDGTAKPQGDDIVRAKTIAKVTSTHVTCTYEDGSYCVPCVLMAC
jgi:hypothetical protein